MPGPWLGGWAWNDAASRLRDRGHRVHPLTLSGLGDRVGSGAEHVDFERHVTDIVEAIEADDLREVVLGGHSYGGWPVGGAADRIAERLARVVYVVAARRSTVSITWTLILIGDRVSYQRADFVCEADSIPAADTVILHRVVCCYPDMPSLVSAAAQHACRVLALSFPRDEWYMSLYIEAPAT